ncbi:MAG: cell envelope protein SmpA [Gammaproteobacteria bacterium]|nr:MAG: cell envelope protein SmpA [Gammaproteobacteria bacterium]
MNNNYLYGGLLAITLSLTACTSSYNTIDQDGKISGDVIFPEMSEATLPKGVFVTNDELAILAAGITKKDLYRTIGRPHFREMNGAREWNYIINFRKADKTAKTCLLKVVFDDNKVAQRFYWQPDNCYGKAQTFSLSADALFQFAKGDIANIRQTGKTELSNIAKTLIAAGNNASVMITGHSDRIGNAIANQRLSERRAESVKRYLVSLGVNADNIQTRGMGERNPIVKCDNKSGQVLISCLAPNRRVTISVVSE